MIGMVEEKGTSTAMETMDAKEQVGWIELRQLRYFAAVAEELHFGRAAERLRIAQPGLSQQIKKLERLLGGQLLIRGKGGIQLTTAGQVLIEHARLVIEQASRAVESTRISMQGKRSILKVGIPSLGMFPAGRELLRVFQDQNPDIELQTHPGYAPQNIEALTRRTLDAAIVLHPFDSPQGMRYLRLGKVELLVALPEWHQLASMDRIPRSALLEEPFLDWPRSINPPLVRHIHHVLFGDVEHPQVVEVYEAVDANRLLLVAEGKGIAVSFFPGLAELDILGIAFRRVVAPEPTLDYGVCWFDENASSSVPAFVEIARGLAEPATE
jgi:DNA-binding transcriptional LysR family regulator